ARRAGYAVQPDRGAAGSSPGLLGQTAGDAIEQGLADGGQGLVNGGGGPADRDGGGLGGRPRGEAGGEQVAVARRQLFQAAGQRLAAVVELQRLGLFDRGFGQAVEQCLAEADPAAAALLVEIEDLEVRDPAAPGGEIVGGVVFVELVPQDQAGLLEDVVG